MCLLTTRSEGRSDFSISNIKKQVCRHSGNEVEQVHCDADTNLKAHELIDRAKTEISSASWNFAVISEQQTTVIVAIKKERR